MRYQIETVVDIPGPQRLKSEILLYIDKAIRNPDYPMDVIEFRLLPLKEKMYEEKTKQTNYYQVFERMEISGKEAETAIGCYPSMKVVNHKIVRGRSVYVIDYPEILTVELIQAFADKWGLKITNRRQLWRKVRQA